MKKQLPSVFMGHSAKRPCYRSIPIGWSSPIGPLLPHRIRPASHFSPSPHSLSLSLPPSISADGGGYLRRPAPAATTARPRALAARPWALGGGQRDAGLKGQWCGFEWRPVAARPQTAAGGDTWAGSDARRGEAVTVSVAARGGVARFLCFYPFVKSLLSVDESTRQNLCCVPDKRHTAKVLFVGVCTPWALCYV